MEMTNYKYIASANDTFDSVALYVYGSEQYAPDLMSANPEYTSMTVFHGGERLFIPVVQEESIDGLPTKAPWKE